MNRRPTPTSTPEGRVRRLAIALLLTSMFLVPLLPMGDAANPGSFSVSAISGATARSTDAVYNFTFNVVSADAGEVKAVLLTVPSGFAMNTIQDSNLPADYTNNGVSGTSGNLTSDDSTYLTAGDKWVRIAFTDVPDYADSFQATLKFFNGTDAQIGSATANIVVSPISLTADMDSAHLDGGSDDIVLGSGATTDYWFSVTWNSAFTTADSVNITFGSAFDLSDASVTNGAVHEDDDEIGYDIQTSGSNLNIKVDDVTNPTVSSNTEYIFTAEIRDSSQRVVARGTFDVDIVATDIVVSSTGANTQIKEGNTEDDRIDVSLRSKPSADVTVTIDTGDEFTSDVTTLTFTTANWDDEQEVQLTAVDDTEVEGTRVEQIILTSSSDDGTYDDLEKTFDITILDNDPGIVLTHTGSDTEVEEGDAGGDTYEVTLATRPSAPVTVTIAPHSNLKVDKTELTFTTSDSGDNSWNNPHVVTVTSNRLDDDDFTDPEDFTIQHTASSGDDDYDGKEAELTVTIVDDEHPALGLTEDEIRRANQLVELTLTEQEDDGVLLEWDLPTQEELDEIFDSDGEITIQGVQVLYSNSPYAIAQTFEEDDDGFSDESYLHEFDDGATLRTKYLVTMYYEEDVGKWTSDDVPDTRDDGYGGSRVQDPLLPWWGWLLVGVGGVILIAIILAAVVASQNRRAYGDVGWEDEGDDEAVAAKEEAPAKDKPRKYDLECPVCDHHFTAKGTKPLKTECPNCGAKGVLN